MILVTGGTGFIGSFVIKKLLEAGRSVLATKRKSSVIPDKLLFKPNLFWHDVDLTDYFALEDLFTHVTQVYHCAGLVSFEEADRKRLMQVNVVGSTHIVNLCLQKNARLLFLSSVAALGEAKENSAITENSKWEWSSRKSAYSISKFEAEREAWRGIAEGLDAVIINPTVVIGPGQNSSSSKIFSLLEKGLRYYPTGSTGFVDVTDLAEIMIRLMELKEVSETNFLINNVNLSYKELFVRYCELINKNPPVKPVNRYTLSMAWRIQKVLSVLNLGAPGLTRDIVQATAKTNTYNNDKIVKTLNYVFKPIETSLKAIKHES